MSQITEVIATIATAIIGVTILALIVSRRSNTVGVLSAAGNSFSAVLQAATSPVTGVGPNGSSMGFGNNTGGGIGLLY